MTPLQAELHENHKRFHDTIARRAALVPQKEMRTYFIPNTPFGVKKINPRPIRVGPNIEPLWWHCMWFADLIAIRAPNPVSGSTVERIQRAVCRKYGVTLNDMKSERRTQNIVEPRQVAMYLCKELTGRSYPEIGRRFGGRDHTTAIHAVRKIAARCVSTPEFAGIVAELKAELR